MRWRPALVPRARVVSPRFHLLPKPHQTSAETKPPDLPKPPETGTETARNRTAHRLTETFTGARPSAPTAHVSMSGRAGLPGDERRFPGSRRPPVRGPLAPCAEAPPSSFRRHVFGRLRTKRKTPSSRLGKGRVLLRDVSAATASSRELVAPSPLSLRARTPRPTPGDGSRCAPTPAAAAGRPRAAGAARGGARRIRRLERARASAARRRVARSRPPDPGRPPRERVRDRSSARMPPSS